VYLLRYHICNIKCGSQRLIDFETCAIVHVQGKKVGCTWICSADCSKPHIYCNSIVRSPRFYAERWKIARIHEFTL